MLTLLFVLRTLSLSDYPEKFNAMLDRIRIHTKTYAVLKWCRLFIYRQ